MFSLGPPSWGVPIPLEPSLSQYDNFCPSICRQPQRKALCFLCSRNLPTTAHDCQIHGCWPKTSPSTPISFLKKLFILFLVVLGLHCYTQSFSSCSKQGLLFLGCTSFSCCKAQALEHGLRSCGMWAELPHNMWNLPGPEIEPISCTSRRIVNHRTTRGASDHLLTAAMLVMDRETWRAAVHGVTKSQTQLSD